MNDKDQELAYYRQLLRRAYDQHTRDVKARVYRVRLRYGAGLPLYRVELSCPFGDSTHYVRARDYQALRRRLKRDLPGTGHGYRVMTGKAGLDPEETD